jgi:hypothetical protein
MGEGGGDEGGMDMECQVSSKPAADGCKIELAGVDCWYCRLLSSRGHLIFEAECHR